MPKRKKIKPKKRVKKRINVDPGGWLDFMAKDIKSQRVKPLPSLDRIIDGKKYVLNNVYATRDLAKTAAQNFRSSGKYFARIFSSRTTGFAVYIRKRI